MDPTRGFVVRARAPLRLGLAGGGSDLSPFCDEFGGYVLNATVALSVYAILQRREDDRVCFIAADREEAFTSEAAPHLPLEGVLPLHKAVYSRIMRDFYHGRALPVTLKTYSDVPAGSGLGSSSTLVVAMIEAFKELLYLPIGEYEVAHLAHSIERSDAGMPGGKQDQYAAAFGGFNFMEFYENSRAIVNPLRIKRRILNELEASLVLFNSGVSRDSDAIIAEQTAGIETKSASSIQAMHGLKHEAVEMKEALLKGDIRGFADVLARGWENKKKTAALVTNPELDRIYDLALSSGAYSGKVSGAGGGGFMMFVVDPSRRPDVWRALEKERGIVMRTQFSEQGATAWRSREEQVPREDVVIRPHEEVRTVGLPHELAGQRVSGSKTRAMSAK
jgi:D-glycero-alpha-D-manno-heptose-7-phosphate kinase